MTTRQNAWTMIAAGLVLSAVIVTRTPAQGGGEDSQPFSSQVAPASMQEQESVCPWDCADFDGTVGINDFLALLAQWGSPGSCDFDGGGVGIIDFLDLLAHWGPCP